MGLILALISLLISIGVALLNWLFGFFSGYWYGVNKGRRQVLHERDRMEELANKQFDRFIDERERANAAVGRAERAEFDLKKKKKSKVKPLGRDEWPDLITDSTDDGDDDDVPTIG